MFYYRVGLPNKEFIIIEAETMKMITNDNGRTDAYFFVNKKISDRELHSLSYTPAVYEEILVAYVKDASYVTLDDAVARARSGLDKP